MTLLRESPAPHLHISPFMQILLDVAGLNAVITSAGFTQGEDAPFLSDHLHQWPSFQKAEQSLATRQRLLATVAEAQNPHKRDTKAGHS